MRTALPTDSTGFRLLRMDRSVEVFTNSVASAVSEATARVRFSLFATIHSFKLRMKFEAANVEWHGIV